MDSSSPAHGGGSDSAISLDAAEIVVAPRPVKKTRNFRKDAAEGKQPAREKRKKSLSLLPTLPLDVLYEIFAHLDPRDLLRLARTTKSFRRVLMARSSGFVWREVLDAAVSVKEDCYPPRPDDMPEPEWTALVFDKPWCTGCGGRTSSRPRWMLRVRLCTECMAEKLLPVCVAMTQIPHMDPDVDLIDVLPCERGVFTSTFIVQTQSLIASHTVNYPSSDREKKTRKIVLRVDDLEVYKEGLKNLREQYPDDTVFAEQRKLFDESLMAASEPRLEHAESCLYLEELKGEMRGNDNYYAKADRHDDIKGRLLDLGYDRRDVEHEELRKHRYVWKSYPLSERIWEKIEPVMKEFVERIRERRINEEVSQGSEEVFPS
ncbi:hypothetical protein PENSPDRAFT_269058 [Peniophora sp. CONT]|nr:hypothetical protein PENSPDRAFT_269058 [Peniophora sp. CONT]